MRSFYKTLRNLSTSNIYTKRLKNRASLNGGVTVDRSVAIDRIRQSSLQLGRNILKRDETWISINLIKNSEEISASTWGKTLVLITSNTTANPLNGNIDADKLAEDTANNVHGIYQSFNSISGTTYTQSIYVQKYTGLTNQSRYIQFQVATNADNLTRYGIIIDLSNGTVTDTKTANPTGTNITSPTNSITAIGSFYRVVLTSTINYTGTSYIAIHRSNSATPTYNSTSNPTYLGNGLDYNVIWGAQLEQNSTATTYQPTQSSPTGQGASFVYTPSSYGEGRNYNVYPQLNNLLQRSEELDNAIWSNKFNTSVSANAVANPLDGLVTADKLIENTANTSHFITQTNLSLNSGYSYVFSAYLKAAGRTKINMNLSDGVLAMTFGFDLTLGTTYFVAGTASNGTSTITNIGNGWYRCSVTRNVFTPTSTLGTSQIAITDNSGNLTYTGDGVSGCYIYGAQWEQGTTATTYQRTTDGIIDFQFTRATTATVTNKDGSIGDSCYNLLSFSEDYTNAYWTKSNTTITANTTANYLGQNIASKLVETTANGIHYITSPALSVSSGVTYTLSVYVKAVERNWVQLFIGDKGAYFDVTNGVIGTTIAGTSTSIIPVTNGFYLCTISGASITNSSCGITLANANNSNSYTGITNNGVYIWGAQLTIGSTLKPYLKTTNRLAVPRLDYQLDLTKPSLLIEPQSTNAILRSQELDITWIKTNTTVTANTVAAPDSILTADKVIANTSNVDHYINQIFLSQPAGTYTLSAYIKKADYDTGYIAISNNTTTTKQVRLNLTTGVITAVASPSDNFTSVTGNVYSVGNGWYRLSVTVVSNAIFTLRADLGVSNNTSGLVFTGDGVSGTYFWGAQLETGSKITTYIPTTTAAVTRNAETSFVDLWNGNLLNSNNFTLKIEGYLFSGGGTARMLCLADTTTGGTNDIGVIDGIKASYVSSSTITSDTSNLSNNTAFKLIIVRDGTSVKWFRNGGQIWTTQTTSVVDYRYLIVSNGNNIFSLNKVELYKESFDDATAISLTT